MKDLLVRGYLCDDIDVILDRVEMYACNDIVVKNDFFAVYCSLFPLGYEYPY
jgi:hypothetical protein